MGGQHTARIVEEAVKAEDQDWEDQAGWTLTIPLEVERKWVNATVHTGDRYQVVRKGVLVGNAMARKILDQRLRRSVDQEYGMNWGLECTAVSKSPNSSSQSGGDCRNIAKLVQKLESHETHLDKAKGRHFQNLLRQRKCPISVHGHPGDLVFVTTGLTKNPDEIADN